MAVDLLTNFSATTLTAAISTTPAAGTVETWPVASTAAPLPQPVNGVTQYRVTVGPATDTSPEIVLVTAVVDSTHLTVVRGYEGSTVKTHASGDAFTHVVTAGFLGSLASAPSPSDSGTIYVTSDGNDANNGVSWSTGKATVAAAVAALPNGVGTVNVGLGTWNFTSSSRTDAGVSYTGSGTTYTWTDTYITSGDVGSYVAGTNVDGRAPKIISVVAGVSFVTDIAPGGAISNASVVIINPGVTIGDGVTLQGVCSPHGAVPGISGGTIFADNGTGVTVFLRGGNNTAAYFGHSKIKDIGIWGQTTEQFATSAGTLAGLLVNNNSSFLEVSHVDFSGHYWWGAAADYNVNSIDFRNCSFTYCGHSGATSASGGFAYGLYNGYASADINFYNCWGDAIYGMWIDTPNGQGSISLYSCQTNAIYATSYYLSGSSVFLTGPNSVIVNFWSETCAEYDVVVNYGYCTIIGGNLVGGGPGAVYIAGSGSTVTLVGVASSGHSSATVVRSAGTVNWDGCAISDATFLSGGPTPAQAVGKGSVGGPFVSSAGISAGSFGTVSSGNQLWGPATGSPSSSSGSVGDFYLRSDGGTGTHLYFKSGTSTWAAIDRNVISVMDYGATGNGTTDDTTAINNAIAALPNSVGTVYMPAGTYLISSTITLTQYQRLVGAGVGATTLTANTDILMVRMGNRQSDGVMRNDMYLGDLTVTQNAGSQTHTNVLVDGGGQGTTIERVQTNEGHYGFELMDLDRCLFVDIEADNPGVAGIVLEVGKENTYGTVAFINARAVLSNNNTYGWYVIANSDQTSSVGLDRITFLSCHAYMTGGLTGCIGFYTLQEMTATSFIGCLFEQNNTHFRCDGSSSSINFLGCSFLDQYNVCANVAYLNAYGSFTFRDCRFQEATNCFNGVSGYPIVMLEGRNDNQANLTNIWTGSFGYKGGTDTNFAGAGQLYLGSSSDPYANVYADTVQLPVSSSAATPGTGSTISTSNLSVARVAPTSAITGVILSAGSYAGQTIIVINEANYSITFAAAGTSHVADGTSDVISALTARTFVWDGSTSLWYRQT